MSLTTKVCITLFGSWIALPSCNRTERDFDISSTISRTISLGIGNFTVVEIDPNGHKPTFHWEAFNKKHGSAFNVPYEILTISSEDVRYVVTDKNVGNNALSVNGVTHAFNSQAKRLRSRLKNNSD